VPNLSNDSAIYPATTCALRLLPGKLQNHWKDLALQGLRE